MALDRQAFFAGNDTFGSDIILRLESISELESGSWEVAISVENVPTGTDGGAFFDPRVVWRRDGSEVGQQDLTLGTGSTVTAAPAIPVGDTPTMEVAIVGDWNAGCWCVSNGGNNPHDCSVSSPTADCARVSGTLDAGTIAGLDRGTVAVIGAGVAAGIARHVVG